MFTLRIDLPTNASAQRREAYALLVERVISAVEVGRYDLQYPTLLVTYLDTEGTQS